MLISSAEVLKSLASAMGLFGNGDRTNAPRVLKIVEPAGLALAVTISSPGAQVVRSACVDALFSLLGSNAFRKEEEIALSVGEALAEFAAAYKTADAAAWAKEKCRWPSDMDLDFALKSPAPVQVRNMK